jgi:hypothetical protein
MNRPYESDPRMMLGLAIVLSSLVLGSIVGITFTLYVLHLAGGVR